jgi:protein unc-80
MTCRNFTGSSFPKMFSTFPQVTI